jgi:class 3 adenylate cyclase
MEDLLEQRVRDLVADAETEADRRAWDRVQALARAALLLDPGNERARQLVDEVERAREPSGEWRQLTVMFADLVGSTGLSEQLSGEAYRDVILRYQQVCDDVITRQGGHIAKFQGDGVLAYFGHPTVHEDDARRGVQAGLDLTTEFAPVANELRAAHGADVALRVAVHTDMVVLSDMGTDRNPEPAAVTGSGPNLAARLQDHARPNSLVISRSTYELVRGYFVAERRGEFQLRGLSRPVEIYEVVGEGFADSRMEATPRLSPFVGRTSELDQLEAMWRTAAEGGTSVAVVVGEPGIGKSRLADMVRRRIADRGAPTIAASCSPQRSATHLWAVRRLVEFACAVSPRSNPEDALQRVRRALAIDGQEEDLPLFAALLEIPPQPSCPAPELAPTRLREETLDAFKRWISRAAAREPRLVVVDDLQWADPSTVELLHRVVLARPPGLFLLMTSRTGVVLPWAEDAASIVSLGPLSGEELHRVAAGIPAGQEIPAAHIEEVIARSDGVPLYFEELLVVAGRGVDPAPLASIAWRHDLPPSLIGPLLTRLEAPGVDVGLLQTMAVIGYEAPLDLLADVSGLDQEALEARLQSFVAAGLVEPVTPTDEDDGGPMTYRFHHRLLWELVYDMQLLPARVHRHGVVADSLLERAGSIDDADGAVLGPHLEQAIRTPDAVLAYAATARKSLAIGGEAEFDTVLRHGFELLDGIADETTRLSVELPLRQLRGLAAMTREGYIAPTAVADHERCLEICQRLPSRAEYLPATLGVWGYYLLKGDLDRAEQVLDAQLERMGETAETIWPGIRIEAGCRNVISLFRGDLERAFQQAEEYLASPHRLMDDAAGPFVVPNWPNPTDPVSIILAHTAVGLLAAGRWGEAARQLTRAEKRAADWPFPYGAFTRGNVGVIRAVVHRDLDEYARSDAAVAEVIEVGDRHGFAFWTLAGSIASALNGALTGAEGTDDRLEALLNVWRFSGVDVWMPYFLTQRARAQLRRGDCEAALAGLREAATTGERTGSLLFAAETARLTGEARLAQGDAAGTADLSAAVKLAAEQGASLFELRARTSLRRHDAAQEDGSRLATLVAEIEGAGPDGGELQPSADLDAARSVLDS